MKKYRKAIKSVIFAAKINILEQWYYSRKTIYRKPIVEEELKLFAVPCSLARQNDSHSIASTPIDSSASILLFTSEIDVVGIDEAQFFDSGLIDVCNQLANNGVRVIVAGLDMDFRGLPFGPMPGLCAIADEVSKVHAICVKCGQLASFSHRTVKNDKQVLLGETAEYEPLCRECYLRAVKEDQKAAGS